MLDENRTPSYALQPGDHVVRVGYAPAQEKQLCAFRCERDCQLIMHAAHGVTEHLKFIHDQETRAFAAEKASPLRLQRRDNNLRIEIERDVTRGDADIPAAAAPFR